MRRPLAGPQRRVAGVLLLRPVRPISGVEQGAGVGDGGGHGAAEEVDRGRRPGRGVVDRQVGVGEGLLARVSEPSRRDPSDHATVDARPARHRARPRAGRRAPAGSSGGSARPHERTPARRARRTRPPCPASRRTRARLVRRRSPASDRSTRPGSPSPAAATRSPGSRTARRPCGPPASTSARPETGAWSGSAYSSQPCSPVNVTLSARTGTSATVICCDVMNGNASSERSASVSEPRMSRAAGPHRANVASDSVDVRRA